MPNVDEMSRNICINCYQKFHRGKPSTIYYEQSHYFDTKAAQEFNKTSRCAICRVYYTKLIGKSFGLFQLKDVDLTNELITNNLKVSRIQEAVSATYHY